MRIPWSAAIAGAVLGAVTLSAPTPSVALSCAAPPAGVPRIAANGGEVAGRPFFDEYNLAVVATVTALETDEVPGSATYGATTIEVDVALVLGDDEAAEHMQLSAADPGWLAGYPFGVGRSYFVPVDAVGPDGEVNHTFVCTPITEVADAEITADRLAAVAAESGVPHARPGDMPASTGSPTDGVATGSTSSASPFVAMGAAVLVLLAIATGAVVVRRRGQPGSPTRRSRRADG